MKGRTPVTQNTRLCCVERKHQQLAGWDAAGECGVLAVGTLGCLTGCLGQHGADPVVQVVLSRAVLCRLR